MTDLTFSADVMRFTDALECEGATPWPALERLAHHVVGVRLFTITAVDEAAGLARRLYTNMAEVYPVSGTKPITRDAWYEAVIEGRRPYVMNTLEEISARFPDWELIGSLGCAACINMPVVYDGRVLGTVNMLDAERSYTAEKLGRLDELRLPALAAFLAADTSLALRAQ